MPSSSRRERLEPVDRSWATDLWKSRFGIPEEVFDEYSFYRRGRMIWLFSRSALPPFWFETAGLRLMSVRKEPWKPTTYALQLLGRYATRNSLALEDDQAKLFISGGSLELEAEVEPGYVIVTHYGDVLGCGLYTNGSLISQLPKERRIKGCKEEGCSP